MKKEELVKRIDRDGKTFKVVTNFVWKRNEGKNTPKKMKDGKRFDILKSCKNNDLKSFYKKEIEAYDKKVKDGN